MRGGLSTDNYTVPVCCEEDIDEKVEQWKKNNNTNKNKKNAKSEVSNLLLIGHT
jgi:hypothetical protein